MKWTRIKANNTENRAAKKSVKQQKTLNNNQQAQIKYIITSVIVFFSRHSV